MKSIKRRPRPWLLFISIILLLMGFTLLFTSYGGFLPPVPTPMQPVLAVPPPTWGIIPTRMKEAAPVSTHNPANIPLQALQQALRQGDLEAAQIAWEEAYRLAPQDGNVQYEGARLALALNDLENAEVRAWDMIRALPKDGRTWALLGLILARREQPKAAAQALSVAQSLSPDLTTSIFVEHWRAARQAGDISTMASLAQTYSGVFPDDPLVFYYRTAPLLSVGDAASALPQLISALKDNPDAPAVLWYTLGEAYLAHHAFTETITVLEVAGSRMAAGDITLNLASDNPPIDLSLKLARAYLGSGRCAEAESIFRRFSSSQPALDPLITQAVLCQTPTPTLTPWMISQQVTATP